MKKGLIITIYDPLPNYGNKLQNYASKTILEKLGIEVATLVTEPQVSDICTHFKCKLNKLLHYRLRNRQIHCVWEKMLNFHNFDKYYLNPDWSFIKGKFNSDMYDFFAVGSDQVWNPEWYDTYVPKKDLFLLTFAEPKQMLCMSPSFGVDRLPDKWIPWFRECLSRFPELAVRERSGVDLIKELTGKDAQLLIDPTLMLNKEEWLKLVKKPQFINTERKYAITYFIGEQTAENRAYINKIAIGKGLYVYNLNDINDPKLFSVGPEEFLYLIQNAEVVFTDSFHACVFSFIFEKPFEVFERKSSNGNMMSRINTLLETFSLERKYAGNGLENDLFECDYSIGMRKLKTEKICFMKYIRECIEL